jgi:hypothetical protein
MHDAPTEEECATLARELRLDTMIEIRKVSVDCLIAATFLAGIAMLPILICPLVFLPILLVMR